MQGRHRSLDNLNGGLVEGTDAHVVLFRNGNHTVIKQDNSALNSIFGAMTYGVCKKIHVFESLFKGKLYEQVNMHLIEFTDDCVFHTSKAN